MKTYIAKSEDLNPKWYILDAKDKILGKIATKIADKLRGKGKPIFSPHMDCGDFVIVVNADKIKLSGKKMDEKMYYTHSGYPGGFKSKNASELLKHKPTKIIELAIRGMLPRNKLRKGFMQKLKLYTGETHPHEAQQPQTLEIN